MDDAISVGIRNPAARESHRSDYIYVSAFCSPRNLGDCRPTELGTKTGRFKSYHYKALHQPALASNGVSDYAEGLQSKMCR